MTTVPRGVVIRPESHDSIESMLDMANRAERLGFDHVTRNETTNTDAVTVLALIADRTDTIGIANDVFSPYSRSPALLAQTAATLQEASHGRYRMGLGVSSPALARSWHGTSYDRPLRRLRETIEIIREAMTGEPVTYTGDLYDLDGLRLGNPPDPPPPIDVAALGPKSAELAGRFADGWIPQYFTPSGFEDRLADFERGLDRSGRDRDDVRVALTVRCCAHDDPERAREIARNSVAFMIGAYGPYYRQSIADQGYADATDRIKQAWDDNDRDAMTAAVPDALLDDIVAAGTPDTVRRQIERFEAIDGLDCVRIGFFGGQPLENQYTTLDVLAPT